MDTSRYAPAFMIAFAVGLFGFGCARSWPTSTPTVPILPPNAPTSTATTTTAPQATTDKTTTPAQKPKSAATPTPVAATAVVTISDGRFSPQIIAVKAGDTVVWVNKDAVSHTSKSDAALIWDSGNIAPGQKFSRVFKAPGSYAYSCAIHSGMKGTVVVR